MNYSPTSATKTRESIVIENTQILKIKEFPANQYVIRLKAPEIALKSLPGMFVHIQCDNSIKLRRPLSIMRANSDQGWIELLFKIVGNGLKVLANRQQGDFLSSLGPIGNGFDIHSQKTKPLLIGGGVGIPPMIYLAEFIKKERKNHTPFLIMGSEIPFPFELQDSKIKLPWLPKDIISSLKILEDWKIPARLTSLQNFESTYRGYVTDLARKYIQACSDKEKNKLQIFACGPNPMLKNVSKLAKEFDLPCQISLEEFMACAVGGCAGCNVMVNCNSGPKMKRVCVDGPVFDSREIYNE